VLPALFANPCSVSRKRVKERALLSLATSEEEMTTKLDLRKQWKQLYAPSHKKVEVVEVPELQFVMIDGQIETGAEPGTSAVFQRALEALYGASYTLKFMSKLRKDKPIDYTVMALEGLWWTESGEFSIERRDEWKWTLMMMQPDHITAEMLVDAKHQIERKRNNPAIADLRLERFREGLCLQTMHVGPYSEEPATIERLKVFARENGYQLRGNHHEIYLGDPRRAKPENLRTILRHPVSET
jgi:hypothetical protein